MATYRTINNGFWTDSKVEEFSPEDRYFFLYLLTNLHTNICGCYEISKNQMGREMGYSAEAINNLIYRFKSIHKVIDYDEETQEVLIINWHKYNWSSSSKLVKAVEKGIEYVENETFRSYLRDVLQCHIDGVKRYPMYTVSIPYTYPMDTSVSVSVINNSKGIIENKGIENTDIQNTKNNNTEYACAREGGSEQQEQPPKKSKKPEEPKHEYGEFSHVLLTDAQYGKLVKDYGETLTKTKIRDLDEYLENHRSTHYDNHNLTIRAWIRGDKEKSAGSAGQRSTYSNQRKRPEYHMSDENKALADAMYQMLGED